MRIQALPMIVLIALVIISGFGCAKPDSTKNSHWKFAVLCDTRGDNNGNNTSTFPKSGINDSLVKNLSEAIIKEEGCELVLVPGGMVNGWLNNNTTSYKGQFDNWSKAMVPVYKKGIKVYKVRGNHEDGPGNFSVKDGKEVPPYIPHSDSTLKMAYINNSLSDKNITNDIGDGPTGEMYLTYSFTHKNAFFAGLDLVTLILIKSIKRGWKVN